MKRVLFVFPQWHFNITDALSALTEKYEVHTLHFTSADEVQQVGKIGANKVKSHSLKLRTKVWVGTSEVFVPSFTDLWRNLSREYDFVLFKNIYDPLSLAGFLFCALKGIPYGVSEQKIKSPSGFSKIYFPFLKLYAKLMLRSRLGVSPTKIGYQQLANYTKKRAYIPFAIATNELPSKSFKQSRVVNILDISKFQQRKNQSLLITVLDNIASEHPKVKFRLTLIGGITKGNDYLNELRAQAKTSLVDVTFLDKVPRDKLNKTYLDADIFVLASYDEPAAYSHLEAMARGLPVICSDENGSSNYIQSGTNGYVFKARSEQSLQAALENILFTKDKLDWEKIARFGIASKKLAQTIHHPKLIAKQYQQVMH